MRIAACLVFNSCSIALVSSVYESKSVQISIHERLLVVMLHRSKIPSVNLLFVSYSLFGVVLWDVESFCFIDYTIVEVMNCDVFSVCRDHGDDKTDMDYLLLRYKN